MDLTLEQVNEKLTEINEFLDGLSTELGATINQFKRSNAFGERKSDAKKQDAKETLLDLVGAIKREIWNDPVVQEILKDSDDKFKDQRNEYIKAIKGAIESTINKLTKYRDSRIIDDEKTIIDDVIKSVDTKMATSLENLEKIDKDVINVTYSDFTRYRDLEEKITDAKNGITIADKFDKVERALESAGKPNTVEEAIKISKELETKFEYYGIDNDNIKKIETINIAEMIKEYKKKQKDPLFEINNNKTKEFLEELKKAAKLLDFVDKLDKSDTAVELCGKMPSNFQNLDDVNEWVKDLEEKINGNKKIDANSSEYKEFIRKRKEFLKEKFIQILKDSPVHKNLYDEDFSNIAKSNFDEDKMKEYLKATTKVLQDYKSIEGKTKADLERYIREAEKLLKSYEIITLRTPNEVTINGKTKTFKDIDMTDENQAKDALAQIKAFPKDDEFRKEIEGEAKSLAGTRPTDRWYHRLLSFITFRRYMTPEDKYLVNLESKKREVVSNLIKDNKQQREEAKVDVDNDKGIFKKIAREFVINDPKGNLNIKEIQQRREKNETLIKEKKEPLTR